MISSSSREPPLRLLELARAPLHRTGEGPLLVAKQGRLQHVFRNGGAVDGDERLLGAAGVIVNVTGQHLFTRPARAGHHHGRFASGHPGRQLEQLGSFGIPVDHGALLHLLGGHIAADLIKQHLRGERLGQIVDGPFAHGAHRAVDIGVGGHQQHRYLWILLADGSQQGEAVHPPHLDIGDHHVKRLTGEGQQSPLAAVRFTALITAEQKGIHQRFAQAIVIFNYQDPGLCHATPPSCTGCWCRGNDRVKQVPSPGTEATPTSP